MSDKYLDDHGVGTLWAAIKRKFVQQVSGKGLSAEDYTTAEKTKLAGIEAGANAYTLPTATAGVKGGVMVGENISVSPDGTISVPMATKVQTGVVRFGNGFDFDSNGRVILDEDEMPSDLYITSGNFSGVSGATVLFNRSADDCISAFQSGKLVLAKLNGVAIGNEGQMPYSILLQAVEYDDSTDINNAGYGMLTFRGFDGIGNKLTADYYSGSSQTDVYIETETDNRYVVEVATTDLLDPTANADDLKAIAAHYEAGDQCELKVYPDDTGTHGFYIGHLTFSTGSTFKFTVYKNLTAEFYTFSVNTNAGTITVSHK